MCNQALSKLLIEICLRFLFRALPKGAQFALYKSKIHYLYIENLKLSRTNRRTFSQEGEDALAAKYLPEKSGSYIDIGSGRPASGNNTYYFYRRGRRGILIDSLANNRRMSQKLRKSDTSYQILIAETIVNGIFRNSTLTSIRQPTQ